MHKKLLVFFLFIQLAWFFPAKSATAMTVTELLQLTQAGASLELDLRQNSYTSVDLIRLAQSLKFQSTLTIIMPAKGGLTIAQCMQIARARPGQVIFRF